jgi:hypothetical protein
LIFDFRFGKCGGGTSSIEGPTSNSDKGRAGKVPRIGDFRFGKCGGGTSSLESPTSNSDKSRAATVLNFDPQGIDGDP